MNRSIGKKTQSLIKMKDEGYNVPSFVYISAEEILENKDIEKLINEKVADLKSELYAVRSSALIEDTDNESYAGQFITKIKIEKKQLAKAFNEVVNHARDYLKGDLSQFSIIIQEYIPADESGILFTRNPLGGREIILESHKGIGEEIVGGEVKPDKSTYFWNQKGNELIETAKKLEALFGFPQDIEWCKKDGKYYILQSRPITTITQDQHEQYQYLDSSLPQEKAFLYEKTEISEIAERPTPFTYSLLEKIYSQNGPVDKVYKKYGVHTEYNNFLKIVGNELFVDKETELKNLLPSYSYLKKADGKPHFATLKGLGRTIRNLFALNKISLSNYSDLKTNIEQRLEQKTSNEFLDDYELIFEINLLTGKALKKMSLALRNQKISIASLLTYPFEEDKKTINFDAHLKGNCLEIADETEFTNKQTSPQKNKEVQKWHESLTPFKQKLYIPIIIEAQQFSQLREYGRWLTVKGINALRKTLPDIENKYLLTISEAKNKDFDEKILKKRKDEYEKFNKFNLPGQLTNIQFSQLQMKSKGVSPGKANGQLVTRKDLNNSKKSVLYTQVLSPDIAKDFDKISGIVSEQGGLLSHLSIIARENNIPVIVQFDLKQSSIKLGDIVEIDGGAGTVK